MQRYNGQLINQFPNLISGNAAAGAQVTIRIKSSGALASLYATDSLSGGTLPNPITADAKGYYGFYAPDGVYTLDVNISNTPQLEIQMQDVAQLKASVSGDLSTGVFAKLPAVYKIIVNGSGSVTFDTRDFAGNVTTGVSSVSVSGYAELFPFFNNAYEIRATFTGTATAEVV